MPTLAAPQMSSNSRSPTNTHAAGSRDPDRVHRGPERLRGGLRPGHLAGVDGAVEQPEHAVAVEELLVPGPRPHGVGQHADLEAVDLEPRQQGYDVRVGQSVRLPELPVGRRAAPRRGPAPPPGTGPPPSRWCAGRASGPTTTPPAASSRAAAESSASTAAAASARASSSKSIVCHGVSVPPQSKMTASMPGCRAAGHQRSEMGLPTGSRTALSDVRGRVGDRDVLALAAGPVLDLDDALGETLADHDDRGHADQLGVLELHARRDLHAVVVQHRQALGGQVDRELGRRVVDRRVLAGRDDVHVGRRDLARPDQAELVVGVLRDGRDRARDTDAVGAHGDRDELAVLVEHLEAEGVGVLAAEREDVAHLDAAGVCSVPSQHGAGVAVADLGGLDGAVGREVAPGHQVEHVRPGDVGAGDPAGALDDARVDEVADAGGVLLPQHAGADVALRERGVLGEVLLVEGLDLDGLELAARAASRRPRGHRAGRSRRARGCRRGA